MHSGCHGAAKRGCRAAPVSAAMAAGSGGSGGSGGGPGPGPGGGGGPGGSGSGPGSAGELHPRTGRLVSLSACGRTARRQQPGQEFNHGLVLSREPLRDGRVFTVRIDRKVRSRGRGTEIWRVMGGDQREMREGSLGSPHRRVPRGNRRAGHRVKAGRGHEAESCLKEKQTRKA